MCSGGEEKELIRTRGRGMFGNRSLFKHNMRVCPAYTKGVHSRATYTVSAFPLCQFRVHINGACLQVYMGIRLVIVKAGRNLLVFERENGLYEARYTSSSI